jgi:hypothetical protein
VRAVRDGLSTLLIWGLYPVWLLAGAADYLCHRRTGIERTTGAAESWLHVAQFASLAIAFACAVLLQTTAGVFVAIAALVLGHSILAYIDVRHTDGRRWIPPFEQTAHGFMDVLPLVAVVLFGMRHWPDIRAGSLALELHSTIGVERALLLASFAVLAGLPVLEELLRTLQRSRVSQEGILRRGES